MLPNAYVTFIIMHDVGDLCTCNAGVLYRSYSEDDDTYAGVISRSDVFIIGETKTTNGYNGHKQRICFLIGVDAVGWINELCCFDVNL
jgi:hypothetical protein